MSPFAAGRVEVHSLRMHGQAKAGHFLREDRIGIAEGDDNRQFVHRFNRFEIAAVIAIGG